MLAIVVQVNPNIGGNLRLFRKSNHVDSWRVAGRPAGPALERSFQLPDRRRRWAAYGVQRHAGARLAAAAHYLQPAITGIKALCDCRRGLRRTAEPLHLRRPQQAFGSVGLAGRLLGPFAGALQADPGAPDAIAKNAKSTAASHVPISSALGPFRNTPAIGVVTCAALNIEIIGVLATFSILLRFKPLSIGGRGLETACGAGAFGWLGW
jgi:hypothetical protein